MFFELNKEPTKRSKDRYEGDKNQRKHKKVRIILRVYEIIIKCGFTISER